MANTEHLGALCYDCSRLCEEVAVEGLCEGPFHYREANNGTPEDSFNSAEWPMARPYSLFKAAEKGLIECIGGVKMFMRQ